MNCENHAQYSISDIKIQTTTGVVGKSRKYVLFLYRNVSNIQLELSTTIVE